MCRTAQDKLAGIQAKLQNKNLSNKRRKGEREEEEEQELVITNIQSLTI